MRDTRRRASVCDVWLSIVGFRVVDMDEMLLLLRPPKNDMLVLGLRLERLGSTES